MTSRRPLTAVEVRAAIIGILSRPGTIGAQVEEIMAVLGRAGKVIGRVWLANQNQWTSGDGWVYRSRIAAALALASDTPMEG